MSQYQRVDPKCALDPIRGMRLLGRSAAGHLTTLRVIAVERGCVYFWRWQRGWTPGTWPFGRMDIAYWCSSISGVEGDRIIAVRLPKIQPGSDAP